MKVNISRIAKIDEIIKLIGEDNLVYYDTDTIYFRDSDGTIKEKIKKYTWERSYDGGYTHAYAMGWRFREVK